MKSKIFVIYCVILFIENSLQFSNSEICSDIVAQNDLNQAQIGRAPISIDVQTGIIARSTISVTIRANENFQFEGFEIQARTQDGEIIGRFQSSDEINLVKCYGKIDTVAIHANDNLKTKVQLLWEAPDVNENLIFYFVVTVVESFDKFWIQQRSSLNVILPNNDQLPNENLSKDEISIHNDDNEIDIYNGCSETKSCFGIPNFCFRGRNCHTLMTVTFNEENDLFTFEFLSTRFSNNQNYVSGGVSLSPSMGAASVIECVRFPTGQVNAYASWTLGTTAAQRGIVDQNLINITHGSLIDGRIYCKVDRVPSGAVNTQGTDFDLRNTEFYLLIASGTNVAGNAVGYHDINAVVSVNTVLLTTPTEVFGFEMTVSPLLLIHGSFMIVAWIGLTSIGIVMARHFKSSWQNKKTCGKDIWFTYHVICMCMTWALTLAGFIIIFIDTGEFHTSVHSILGCFVLALSFIQPIGAIFRPGPKDNSRPLFNWMHKAFGNITHLLAIITIFYAVGLPRALLPQYTMYVLVAFVVFYLFMHIIFNSIDICGKMRVEKSLGVGESKSTPYNVLQKTLLGLFVIVILLFVIGLLLIFNLDISD
ncbi:hypothetical protein PVAND_004291 [Polypedilum vanderplanki]|uniref:Ferric-chelate reductase 1-like protein n=1 Tax=Polypedilum vanderplanki TaxID=319348 RepID=A0A9J6BX47_POLVA|nr:hypothetical protein PVAND_004291 [Polypedilum vanderplanki]